MSPGSPFHSVYSVTGNVVIGQEGGGQLVNGQILLFFFSFTRESKMIRRNWMLLSLTLLWTKTKIGDI